MSVYPSGVDSFSTKIDNVTEVMAIDVNGLQDSVVAIETTLGLNPQGAYSTVGQRITAIEASGVGASGYSGYSSYSGYSGYSGHSGPSGLSGFSGYSGPTGTSGYSGYSGGIHFSHVFYYI